MTAANAENTMMVFWLNKTMFGPRNNFVVLNLRTLAQVGLYRTWRGKVMALV